MSNLRDSVHKAVGRYDVKAQIDDLIESVAHDLNRSNDEVREYVLSELTYIVNSDDDESLEGETRRVNLCFSGRLVIEANSQSEVDAQIDELFDRATEFGVIDFSVDDEGGYAAALEVEASDDDVDNDDAEEEDDDAVHHPPVRSNRPRRRTSAA